MVTVEEEVIRDLAMRLAQATLDLAYANARQAALTEGLKHIHSELTYESVHGSTDGMAETPVVAMSMEGLATLQALLGADASKHPEYVVS